jgi:predicted ATP-dependent endonuclease of OLD family
LTKNSVNCILGKNAIGKTILFKALQNLITSSTFAKTSNKYIFNETSSIKYIIDNEEYLFEYDKRIESIDFKGIIP